MKYLIIGLGNIGAEYSETRHNIGFKILDAFVEASNVSFESARYGDRAVVKFKGRQFILIKPSTYMNLSGKAVRYWMQKENIPVDKTLTVVDDIALPFGKTRLKTKGSDAGHNGLKNIIELLGSSVFPRLKIGIGADFSKGKQIDYVLGKWSTQEEETIPEISKRAIETIKSFGTIGAVRTMNFFN